MTAGVILFHRPLYIYCVCCHSFIDSDGKERHHLPVLRLKQLLMVAVPVSSYLRTISDLISMYRLSRKLKLAAQSHMKNIVLAHR